jgi:hypothetical protein
VTVDEIAGDGAGRPFAHAIARWLHREFMEPFAAEGRASPFTVALILADASLAYDQVLSNYLLNDVEAPEKVLVVRLGGPQAIPPRSRASSPRRPRHACPARHAGWLSGRTTQI